MPTLRYIKSLGYVKMLILVPFYSDTVVRAKTR